jgi:3-hydroxyacyl-CoA dehydrogenase
MLAGYGREAQMLLMDGCAPKQVDSALENFGMAMGPLAMGDLAGLDVGYKARQARTDLPDDPKLYRMGTLLVEMGKFGQKTGSGFYKYDPETRARLPDPEVDAMIVAEAEKLGIERKAIDDEEILARCLYPLINEGALILEEGIAQRPSDIDVVYVFGYAFPAAKGGPMHYADSIGLKKVYDKICEFRDLYGEDYWKPAPLLKQLAESGSTFAQWDKQRGEG